VLHIQPRRQKHLPPSTKHPSTCCRRHLSNCLSKAPKRTSRLLLRAHPRRSAGRLQRWAGRARALPAARLGFARSAQRALAWRARHPSNRARTAHRAARYVPLPVPALTLARRVSHNCPLTQGLLSAAAAAVQFHPRRSNQGPRLGPGWGHNPTRSVRPPSGPPSAATTVRPPRPPSGRGAGRVHQPGLATPSAAPPRPAPSSAASCQRPANPAHSMGR